MTYDVAIIGGGPAGSSCAVELVRSGMRVILLERDNFASHRAGETLDARVKSLVEGLGGTMETWSCCEPCSGMASIWGGDELHMSLPAIFSPYGTLWRVDRAAFDRELFRLAESLGVVAMSSVEAVSCSRQGGLWKFECHDKITDKTTPMQAHWIVEATGRRSCSVFAPDRERIWSDRLLSLAIWTDPTDWSFPSDALIQSLPEGWIYATRLPQNQWVVVFFTDTDLLPRGLSQRAQFLTNALKPSFLNNFESQNPAFWNSLEQGQWRVFDARTSIRKRPITDGWLAIGDAFASIDPLSGQGVFEALSSGSAAATFLLDLANNHSFQFEPNLAIPYLTQRSTNHQRHLINRAKTYASEKRWPNQPFWMRRI